MTTHRTMTTEIIKGSPSYTVTDDTGAEIARAHCVNVPNALFTLVVDGKWAGAGPQDVIVAKLNAMTTNEHITHIATDDACDTLCGIDLVVISDEFPGGVCIATDLAYADCPVCIDRNTNGVKRV